MLLSGIGPAAQSKALKIPSVVDLPDVGQNMQDHPLLTTNFEVSSKNTLDNMISNATLQAEQLALWQENRSGMFTLGACNQWIWDRLPSNDPIFKTVQDPSSGSTAPHYQLIFSVSASYTPALAAAPRLAAMEIAGCATCGVGTLTTRTVGSLHRVRWCRSTAWQLPHAHQQPLHASVP